MSIWSKIALLLLGWFCLALVAGPIIGNILRYGREKEEEYEQESN